MHNPTEAIKLGLFRERKRQRKRILWFENCLTNRTEWF